MGINVLSELKLSLHDGSIPEPPFPLCFDSARDFLRMS